MDLLIYAVIIFFLGYLLGAVVAAFRCNIDKDKARTLAVHRCCGTCRYCYPISEATKGLMHKEYADKKLCIMCRGSDVPVGSTGCTISVVGEKSFCDKWKGRGSDG